MSIEEMSNHRVNVGNLPTMNQDEYPGLGDWWVQLRTGPDNDEVLARVYGDSPEQANDRACALRDALNVANQPRPAVPDTGGDLLCQECGWCGDTDSAELWKQMRTWVCPVCTIASPLVKAAQQPEGSELP